MSTRTLPMNRMSVTRHIALGLALIFAGVITVHARSSTEIEVDKLINAGERPDGVVFELVGGGKNAFQWATPLVRDLRSRLQTRFPDLDVVLVSHGGEQFQLVAAREQEQPLAIAGLRELSQDGMNVHVCGIHSSWRDVPVSAYADFVDVSASGPAQINDYVALGYKLIMVRKP